MTVTGLDHTGIIAAVSTALAELDINIINVSQTLMDNYFTMIMHIEFDETKQPIASIQERMHDVELQQSLRIRVQSETLFEEMHTL